MSHIERDIRRRLPLGWTTTYATLSKEFVTQQGYSNHALERTLYILEKREVIRFSGQKKVIHRCVHAVRSGFRLTFLQDWCLIDMHLTYILLKLIYSIYMYQCVPVRSPSTTRSSLLYEPQFSRVVTWKLCVARSRHIRCWRFELKESINRSPNLRQGSSNSILCNNEFIVRQILQHRRWPSGQKISILWIWFNFGRPMNSGAFHSWKKQGDIGEAFHAIYPITSHLRMYLLNSMPFRPSAALFSRRISPS